MTDILSRFIEELSLIQERDEVLRLLRRTSYRMGFEFFCYLSLNGKKSFAVSNYPKAWQDRYFLCAYDQIDPVIRSVRTSGEMFSWSGEPHYNRKDRSVSQFFDDAAQVGIKSGISIPISVGFGAHAVLTFASGSGDPSIGSFRSPVQAASVAALLHAHLTYRRVEPTSRPVPKLTSQQALCLKWSAEGKKMEDIAGRLSLAKHSVRFHLDEARRRLGATNIQNATAIATALDLL